MIPALWSVYLLYHPVKNRTYVGATTNPDRRLRQHNKEIGGGARSTTSHAPGWTRICHIEGFLSRSEACRWEKLLKHAAMGLIDRARVFRMLAQGLCPGKKQFAVPGGLILVPKTQERSEDAQRLPWPIDWEEKELRPEDIQPLQFSRRRRRRSVSRKRGRVGKAKRR